MADDIPDRSAPSAGSGGKVLLAFIAGLVLVPGLVIGLFLLAVDRAGGDVDGVGSPDGSAAAPPPVQNGDQAAAADDGPLAVLRLDGPVGDPDPFAAYWNDAPAREVTMLPQNLTMPALMEPSIERMRVQAATDGTRIAWRLAWRDPTPDATSDAGAFPDAVAVQFPVVPGSNVMMGLGGGKVQVLHWKASWQRDVDHGFQDVDDRHPYAYQGLYWFARGEAPWRLRDGDFDDPRAQQYLIAYRAGNPLSDWTRGTPAEELVAEGFGTLTTHRESATTAAGAWSWDTWAVVFVRPLNTDDRNDYQFPSAGDGQIALAVWQGSDGNVGGRKHWSNWVDFRIEP